jgi:transposase
MWTSKNRARYDRSKLRYPSDLTDDEWGLVEPLIPPGKTGGGKRTVIMREVVNGLMYVCRPAVSGARSRKICRREVRSMATSTYGPMMAPWSESTTRSINSVENKRSGKPVRPPPSSTARA